MRGQNWAPIDTAAGYASPTARQMARLERDLKRGYSINVKQVVLAFAVEFVIIGLILLSQFVYAAEFSNPSPYKTTQALLFPIAFAMVELARVPLAIAVRTQDFWPIKLVAVVGVCCAVVVTAFSLSQIGHLTFNPRLEAAHDKRKALSDLESQRQTIIDQKTAAEGGLAQTIKDRDSATAAHTNLVIQLNAQPPQNCALIQRTQQDGTKSSAQVCRENPALKTLKTELAAASGKLNEAERAVKQAQLEAAKYDTRLVDEKINKAKAEHGDSIYQSQLHSYTAMLFQKDPREVTDGEVKTLEWYLIFIPSIAAALSSTLIAMTAVRRFRPIPSAGTTIPDDAAAYLFGPLVAAIKAEAKAAVTAAVNGRVKPEGSPSVSKAKA
jgi:hypothetical protein